MFLSCHANQNGHSLELHLPTMLNVTGGREEDAIFGLLSWSVVTAYVTLHTSITMNFTGKAPRDSKYSPNYLMQNKILPQLFSYYATHFSLCQ